MKVLRSMKPDEDGLPKPGVSGRYLGVRETGKFHDIEVNESGEVSPGSGGMSVSPPPPENLPEHRRPPEYGGYGGDPVYELDTDGLSSELVYRPDEKDPGRHGFIEPAQPMSFADYLRAVHDTRSSWRLVR